jgi:hypothetical protein
MVSEYNCRDCGNTYALVMKDCPLCKLRKEIFESKENCCWQIMGGVHRAGCTKDKDNK